MVFPPNRRSIPESHPTAPATQQISARRLPAGRDHRPSLSAHKNPTVLRPTALHTQGFPPELAGTSSSSAKRRQLTGIFRRLPPARLEQHPTGPARWQPRASGPAHKYIRPSLARHPKAALGLTSKLKSRLLGPPHLRAPVRNAPSRECSRTYTPPTKETST